MITELTIRAMCAMVLATFAGTAGALSLGPVSGSAVVELPVELSAPTQLDELALGGDGCVSAELVYTAGLAATASLPVAATPGLKPLRPASGEAAAAKGAETFLATPPRRPITPPRSAAVGGAAPGAAPRLQLAAWDPGSVQMPWLRASMELNSMPASDSRHRVAATALWRALSAQPQDLLRTAERLRGLEGEVNALRSLAVGHRFEITSARESLESAQGERVVTLALAALQSEQIMGLNGDALHGDQQQAEFFVSLGQFDEAISVLSAYREESSQAPVLPFLELFRIYHALGMQAEYEALQAMFRQTFGMETTSFGDYQDEHRELELFPAALRRISAAWPSKASQDVVEDLLFEKPATVRDPSQATGLGGAPTTQAAPQFLSTSATDAFDAVMEAESRRHFR